ncbi:MAG: hypothetical protein RI894_2158 [Bacteroidota bacterium]
MNKLFTFAALLMLSLGAVTATYAQPSTYKEWFSSAEEKLNTGKYTLAIADYTKAIALNPGVTESYMKRGTAKLKNGDDDGASLDFTQVIRLQPNNALAYASRSETKSHKSDLQGALFDINKAISLDGNNADFFQQRGLVSAKMGLTAQAEADKVTVESLRKKGADSKTETENKEAQVFQERKKIDPKNDGSLEANTNPTPIISRRRPNDDTDAAAPTITPKEMAVTEKKEKKEKTEKTEKTEKGTKKIVTLKEEEKSKNGHPADEVVIDPLAKKETRKRLDTPRLKQNNPTPVVAVVETAVEAPKKVVEAPKKVEATVEVPKKAVETPKKVEATVEVPQKIEVAVEAPKKAEDRKIILKEEGKVQQPNIDKELKVGDPLAIVGIERTSSASSTEGAKVKHTAVETKEAAVAPVKETPKAVVVKEAPKPTFVPTPAKENKEAVVAAKPAANDPASVTPAPKEQGKASPEEIRRSIFNEARRRAKADNHRGAIEEWNKVIEMNPKDAAALLNRAISKGILEDTDGAIADFNAAAALAPEMAEIYYNRGNLYFDGRRYLEAMNDYSEALKKNNSYVQAYLNRALAKRALGGAYNPCEDWQEAKRLGSPKAKKMIEAFCDDEIDRTGAVDKKKEVKTDK